MNKSLIKTKDRSAQIFWIIFGGGILSRLAMFGICLIMMKIFHIDKDLAEFFSRYCDTEHYMYIAQNGYASTGDAVNKIVFYPLLPYLMKVLHVVFRSYLFSGFFITYVSFGFASAYMYKLMSLDFDSERIADALILLFIAPFGMFFISIYTESTFLMLSIMTLYYARKENWIAAAAAGFFGALCKTQGTLLIAPVAYELILCCVRDKKFHKKGLAALLIPMGLVVYLGINKAVLGDFFAFVEHQAAAPWYNTAKWVSDSLSTSYSVGVDHYSLSLIIYWPQISMFFAAVALIFVGLKKKVRTSYLVFMGLYILATYFHGWMLSGARYLTSCFVMYIIMASIDNKFVKYMMYFVSGTLCIYLMVLWIQGYAIM